MTCPPGAAKTGPRGRFFFLAALLLAWAAAPPQARADDALEFYPSFYPHEIRIEVVSPASASKLFASNSLHAYVGADPFPGGKLPAGLGHVESLGSYLVATFNRASPTAGDRDARCAAALRLTRALGAAKGAYVFHPYPVTPFHADYLRHFDLAEPARAQVLARPDSTGGLKLRAKGRLAEQLVPPAWRATGPGWDATVEEVDAQELVASSRISLNGWLGPPWLKEGWFHAYLLHRATVADATAKRNVEAIYQRLATGAFESEIERINLERSLVTLLRGGCERLVLGYTARREYFNNSDYSEGIENVAHDSQAGLNAPIFLRTAKLKDFLWNGWLRLGLATKPRAAWNPMGGFTDATGRLIWSAVGDPAGFPAPYSSSWVPNRVTATLEGSSGVEVPKDALLPEPGTGLLRPIGTGQTAKAKILYRVLLSSFHDKTPMTAADVLYPLSLAYRSQDRSVETSSALLREWLAGVRVLKLEQDVKDFGETKFTFQVQIVEVYLKHALTDPEQLATVAPPWSSLPWQLIALMEEAATRGVAALSQEEAKRRGLPWLDLVRDQRLRERLATVVEEFAREGYVPPSLKGLVTPDQARTRWAALKQFHATHRHFLVTNGPYRLHQWSADSVVLQAFRDPSYPLGLAVFNQYAIPRRAYVSKLEVRNTRLEVRAEVEKVFAFQRSYKLVREPFRGQAGGSDAADLPLCRYVAVASDGSVAAAGRAPFEADGAFRLDLKRTLKPGTYTLLLALSVAGNDVNPEVKTMRLTLPGF